MASGFSPKKDFTTRFYKDVMPKIYGIGASIVIFGAMFKLLNWSGGALMLGVGLTTEAVIFFLSAFEPHEQEVDWSIVYPELREGYAGGDIAVRPSHFQGPVGEKLDDLFAQAKIDGALIERLGEGMSRLSDSVANMAALPDVSAATEKYTASIEKASDALNNMYEAHTDALGAVNKLASVSQDIQGYQEQSQGMAETLQALNTAYRRELEGVDLRARTTQEVYTHISKAMERMQTASREAEKFETELGQLSEKIASLNSIYGNMLTALKN